jgi:glycosyltransferase involved in cell wall biosynthesis
MENNMTHDRCLFSICVPAYNRAKYLRPLLDSVLSQDFKDFEIIICEDDSPERNQIGAVVSEYQEKYPNLIAYYEHKHNFGYDASIRDLVEKAAGEFCFFLGNDDLMCEGALAEAARLISSYKNVGLVLKSYSWFDGSPDNIAQTVKYFGKECEFKAGREAIRTCLRRSGVIAGYIVNRDSAYAAETAKFDGTLFYQMHLTASVLSNMNAVFTPKVLVLCRNGEPPEFGNSGSERGKYVPGSFTSNARLSMVQGVLSIVKNLKRTKEIDVFDDVMRDYSNYFYSCIRDQLDLPIGEYWRLYRRFSSMGFNKYPMFHIYVFVAYLLGQKKFDWIVKKSQQILGRSVRFS